MYYINDLSPRRKEVSLAAEDKTKAERLPWGGFISCNNKILISVINYWKCCIILFSTDTLM
jgi:hypothetical protein